MNDGDQLTTDIGVEGSDYRQSPAPAAGTLKREPTFVKTVDEMRLSELLKLSDALSRISTIDLGTVVLSAGVGLAGAAIGAAATGESLLSGVPLFCFLVGIVSILFGFALSHERGEQIAAVRRNLDFDIDGWCQDDSDAAEMQDRERKAMRTASLFERGVQTWRKWRAKRKPQV
jgi:hypothetical protein